MKNKEIVLKATAQADIDSELREFEFDLLACFQGIEAEAFSLFKKGISAGKTAEQVIDSILALLDSPLEIKK